MAPPEDAPPGPRERGRMPHRLAALENQIQRLRAQAAAGESFDLTPLERRVADLCAGIEGLPSHEARRLRVSLLALIADFDLLAGQLKAHVEQLRAELNATGERRRAARAYAGRKTP